MIAIDTSVLLRYLVRDDENQAELARQLIQGRLTVEEPGFISLPVLCELIWSLGRSYRQTRDAIASAVNGLLGAQELEIEDEALVKQALGKDHDIVDGLIHRIGLARGCERTVTFDRRFARIEGVELLRP